MTMLAPGSTVQQRYRVGHLIGQGGFGAVYEAVDERLGRRVALKQLLRASERLARQFEREAQLLANLQHPALPRVTDHFTTPDGQFLVMDYVPGDDLGTLLLGRDTPFPLPQVLAWGDQLLDALNYLHSCRPPIIHRDIKPQNLKLKADGTIMLLDFGLAKGSAGETPPSTGERSLMAYTKGYAPPEQVEGLGTDARSDLYALGATLYCLLTNTPPVEAQTRLLAEARGRPDPLPAARVLNPAVPEPVSRVLMGALALDPNRRPPSAQAMRASLEAARAGRAEPWPAVAASEPTVVDAQTIAPAPWWDVSPPSEPRSAAPPQTAVAPAAVARSAPAAVAGSVPAAAPAIYAAPAPEAHRPAPASKAPQAAPAPRPGISGCTLSCLLVSLVVLIGLGVGGWYAVRWGLGVAQRNIVDPAQQTFSDLNPAVEELANTVPTSLAELANALPTAAASPAAEPAGSTALPNRPDTQPAAAEDIGSCEVTSAGLNLRSGPGADYPPIAQLVRGTPLQPLERTEDSGWMRVRFEAVSIEGWVSAGEQFVSCADAVWRLPVGTAP